MPEKILGRSRSRESASSNAIASELVRKQAYPASGKARSACGKDRFEQRLERESHNFWPSVGFCCQIGREPILLTC